MTKTTKTLNGELMPPETIQCDCCETILRFGVDECSKCHSRVLYFMNRPKDVIDTCAVYFALPFAIPLLFPGIGQLIGWPTTVAVCLSLGGMLARWVFVHSWPQRHKFKFTRFYRKTLDGYSTKSVSEEQADAMYPYLAILACVYLAVCFAASFAFVYGAQSVLAMLGAPIKIDIWAWASYSTGPISIAGIIYANRRGWLDKLKSMEKKFFA